MAVRKPRQTMTAAQSVARMLGVATGTTSLISAPVRPAQRKYRNQPVEVDGQRFDSKREAERYGHLRMLEQAGVIRDLFVHEAFPLVVHGQDCGAYISDFTYVTETGERVIEDVKSPATRKLPTYRLKARLVWALYGLRIREVS